jgi:serine/threonine protein kinase
MWKIVMDYMGGGSVTNLITVNGVIHDERVIAYIIREMLKALSVMHKKVGI